MPKMIFVNLPVSDLKRAVSFYEGLGAKRDQRFCDDTAACMVLSDAIHVMLLTHDKFRSFTTKRIADTRTSAQVLLCLSEENRQAVDAATERAVAAGGTADPCPVQDYGFMYGRSFEDPDGHVWEVIWMDVAAFEHATGRAAEAA